MEYGELAINYADGTLHWRDSKDVIKSTPLTTVISHSHGNITNAGAVTESATVANGDTLLIADTSDSSKVKAGITFGTSDALFLRNDGTWGVAPDAVNISTYTVTTQATKPQSFELDPFGSLMVYLDGLLLTVDENYTISGSTVTFTQILPVGVEVKFVRFTALDISALPVATEQTLGTVKIDNYSVKITGEGQLYVNSLDGGAF